MKMSMMQRLLVAAALAATPAFAAAADGEKVQASGEGVGSSKAIACENAKKAAMRSAVETTAGVFLAADSLAKDSMLVHDKILTRADGFVSGVKVLDEKASAITNSSDQQCAVKIEAVVEKSKLGDEAKKIAAAFAARGRPKVLLMIAEQTYGMVGAAGWWNKEAPKGGGPVAMKSADLRQIETVMMGTLGESGWKFVDPETLKGKISLKGPVSLNPSNEEIREFGKLAAAEVVIWGHAKSEEPTVNDIAPGVLVATAEISARAVATDSGEVYAVYSGRKTRSDFSPQRATNLAMADLGKAAAKELERKIVDEWVAQAYGTQRIVLKVKGLKDFTALTKFKAALKSGISGLDDVTSCKFEAPNAACDVHFDGGAEALGEALALAAFQEYAINVEKVSGSTIDLTLTGGGGKKK